MQRLLEDAVATCLVDGFVTDGKLEVATCFISLFRLPSSLGFAFDWPLSRHRSRVGPAQRLQVDVDGTGNVIARSNGREKAVPVSSSGGIEESFDDQLMAGGMQQDDGRGDRFRELQAAEGKAKASNS